MRLKPTRTLLEELEQPASASKTYKVSSPDQHSKVVPLASSRLSMAFNLLSFTKSAAFHASAQAADDFSLAFSMNDCHRGDAFRRIADLAAAMLWSHQLAVLALDHVPLAGILDETVTEEPALYTSL